jgi:hypothetical protein
MVTETLVKERLINLTAKNKEYFNSGGWKCDKSPGGAHYWIVSEGHMTCKHCMENRLVPPNPYTFQDSAITL